MNKKARLNYIHALSSQVERKKMYKAKKQWVVAGISFLVAAGMGAVSHLTTHAASINNGTNQQTTSVAPKLASDSASNVNNQKSTTNNVSSSANSNVKQPASFDAVEQQAGTMKQHIYNHALGTTALKTNSGNSSQVTPAKVATPSHKPMMKLHMNLTANKNGATQQANSDNWIYDAHNNDYVNDTNPADWQNGKSNYEGLSWKYNKNLNALEFTGGNLNWNGNTSNWSAFNGYNDNLYNAPTQLNSASSIKFDDNVTTNGLHNMVNMFTAAGNVQSLYFGKNFTTNNVTAMNGLFRHDTSLKNVYLANFDTRRATDLSDMFDGDNDLQSVTIGSPNTKFADNSNLPSDMYHQISDNTFATINGSTGNFVKNDKIPANAVVIGEWGTAPWRFDNGTLTIGSAAGSETDMETNKWPQYFTQNNYINQNKITHIICKNVKAPVDSAYLFEGPEVYKSLNMNPALNNLESIDVSGLDTSSTTDMGTMFAWNTPKLTQILGLNSPTFKTSQVKNMNMMFAGNKGLQTLDLSNFDTSGLSLKFSDHVNGGGTINGNDGYFMPNAQTTHVIIGPKAIFDGGAGMPDNFPWFNQDTDAIVKGIPWEHSKSDASKPTDEHGNWFNIDGSKNGRWDNTDPNNSSTGSAFWIQDKNGNLFLSNGWITGDINSVRGINWSKVQHIYTNNVHYPNGNNASNLTNNLASVTSAANNINNYKSATNSIANLTKNSWIDASAINLDNSTVNSIASTVNENLNNLAGSDINNMNSNEAMASSAYTNANIENLIASATNNLNSTMALDSSNDSASASNAEKDAIAGVISAESNDVNSDNSLVGSLKATSNYVSASNTINSASLDETNDERFLTNKNTSNASSVVSNAVHEAHLADKALIDANEANDDSAINNLKANTAITINFVDQSNKAIHKPVTLTAGYIEAFGKPVGTPNNQNNVQGTYDVSKLLNNSLDDGFHVNGKYDITVGTNSDTGVSTMKLVQPSTPNPLHTGMNKLGITRALLTENPDKTVNNNGTADQGHIVEVIGNPVTYIGHINLHFHDAAGKTINNLSIPYKFNVDVGDTANILSDVTNGNYDVKNASDYIGKIIDGFNTNNFKLDSDSKNINSNVSPTHSDNSGHTSIPKPAKNQPSLTFNFSAQPVTEKIHYEYNNGSKTFNEGSTAISGTNDEEASDNNYSKPTNSDVYAQGLKPGWEIDTSKPHSHSWTAGNEDANNPKGSDTISVIPVKDKDDIHFVVPTSAVPSTYKGKTGQISSDKSDYNGNDFNATDAQGNSFIPSNSMKGLPTGYHVINTNSIPYDNKEHDVDIKPNQEPYTITFKDKDNKDKTVGSHEFKGLYGDTFTISGKTVKSGGNVPYDYQFANPKQQTSFTYENSNNQATIEVTPVTNTPETINYVYGHTPEGSNQISGTYGSKGTITTSDNTGLNSGWKVQSNTDFTYSDGSKNVNVVPIQEKTTVYYIPSGKANQASNAVGSNTFIGNNYKTKVTDNGFNYEETFDNGIDNTKAQGLDAGYKVYSQNGKPQTVQFTGEPQYVTVQGIQQKPSNPNDTEPYKPNQPSDKTKSSSDVQNNTKKPYVVPTPNNKGKGGTPVTPNQKPFTPKYPSDASNTIYIAINKFNGKNDKNFVGGYVKQYTKYGKTGDQFTINPNDFAPAGYNATASDESNDSGTFTATGLSRQVFVFNYDAQQSKSADVTVHYVNTYDGNHVISDANNGITKGTKVLSGSTDEEVTAPIPANYELTNKANNTNKFTISTRPQNPTVYLTPENADIDIIYQSKNNQGIITTLGNQVIPIINNSKLSSSDKLSGKTINIPTSELTEVPDGYHLKSNNDISITLDTPFYTPAPKGLKRPQQNYVVTMLGTMPNSNSAKPSDNTASASSASASALASLVANDVSNATKSNQPSNASFSLTSNEVSDLANKLSGEIVIKPTISEVNTSETVDNSALTSLASEVATNNQEISNLANKPANSANIDYNYFNNLVNSGVSQLTDVLNTDFKADIRDVHAKSVNAPTTKGVIKKVHRHLRWIMINKPVALYTKATNVGSKHDVARVLKPSRKATLDIKAAFKVQNHYVFKVSFNHHTYFILDDHKTFKNAYLTRSHKFTGRKVRVIQPVYEFKHKTNGIVKKLHKGSVLRIKRIIRIGHFNATRIQLSNNNWISANKNYIKVL